MPKLGQKDTCKSCGKTIEYIGPYWRHIPPHNPRHPATPTLSKKKEEKKMSHKFVGSEGTKFFYNSDFSGDVRMMMTGDTDSVEVPCSDVMEFCLEFLRSQAITYLENLDISEHLKRSS